MTLPDVNVLIHAFRADSVQHSQCREWLDSVVNAKAPFGMAPQVLSSIRILTNRQIHKQPDPLDGVLAFVDLLLDQTHCQVIQPGPEHWKIFTRLCRQSNASGPLIPDAWFAALAIESGCEWVTLDRDYARFEGLRWRRPF